MQTMKQAAAGFLAGKRVAVTGVSRHPKDHGSNVVYQRLRQRGYTVFAVNPNADKVEGDTCYHDLKSIPGGVDWVVIGTRPEQPTPPCGSAPISASTVSGCTAGPVPGACRIQPLNMAVSTASRSSRAGAPACSARQPTPVTR